MSRAAENQVVTEILHGVCIFFLRDAVVVATINCMTSLFGGFAIFSVIGFMAHTLNKEVSDVVSSGKQYDVAIVSAGRLSIRFKK